MTTDVTRHIEARNLTRRKDNNNEKFLKYTCDHCDYTISYWSHLNKHKKSKHDGVKFNCDQCDFTSSYLGNLNLHKKNKHEKPFTCDHCGV